MHPRNRKSFFERPKATVPTLFSQLSRCEHQFDKNGNPTGHCEILERVVGYAKSTLPQYRSQSNAAEEPTNGRPTDQETISENAKNHEIPSETVNKNPGPGIAMCPAETSTSDTVTAVHLGVFIN
eukprot:TRINITY_DN105121_c0_g1_i1.p1 TRINITY_DN105121_c0_g1~~TRINITY_DN105121_c0_g1_i1.p1  ORF type:complete len:125 (+),score=6.07 TRINITY_DN105121_c0_g1_i1:61-435(+)